jgi:two-component system chemotaxis sensor kinase CheA
VLGEGTEFQLEIPLRKAVVVVDGLLIKQNDETFIMPFEFIREIFEFQRSEITTAQGRMIARIRGEPYAAISLGSLLGLETQSSLEETTIRGILITCKQGTACLLVDAIIGQRKVVINNLSDIMPNTDKVSGVAQLGGGQLALVLSPTELVNWA